MEPALLFGIQFTLSLTAYALIAVWYVAPRLAALPLEKALVPLIWVHAFRSVGLTILAPGAVDVSVPADFQAMIGYGDLASTVLALLSLLALHYRIKGAIVFVWVFNVIGMLDVINAFIQSIRYGALNVSLGVGWLIVTLYVPALVVSGLMIFYLLLNKRNALA
jgi:hypothetical protein